MSYEKDRHLENVDRTVRLSESLQDGVFYDEFHRPIPIAFARCVHGNCVFGCEECKEQEWDNTDA